VDSTKIAQIRNNRFILEIEGITQTGFAEIITSEASMEVVEVHEAGMTRKSPGVVRYSNLILKWAMTESIELYNWFKDVSEGKINASRKDILLILLDETGQEAAKLRFKRAWPIKYIPPSLNTMKNEIAIETIEIFHEGMIREK
jgi:phage tail-like protein